ncbi:hypothetical protein [Thiolapillus sp.]
MKNGFMSGMLLALAGTAALAAPANELQTEEITLKDGTRLVVIHDGDGIMAISSNNTLFITEEQAARKTAYKPFRLSSRQGHYPSKLEKAPPLPDRVPEEIRNRLQSWRILDDAGNVMDVIFCTEQGCSIGGYSYTAQR